jgi:hypothetical protein
MTHSAVTSSTATSATATSAATTTSRRSAARTISTGVAISRSFHLLAGGFRLASKLNRDLALKNFLARELGDSTLSLGRSGEVDKGVANGAVGAGVLWDRDRLTVRYELAELKEGGV